MNIASIFIDSLAPVAVVIIPLLLTVTAIKMYSPIIIGWFGEMVVRKVLDNLGPDYTCFHDVLLPINGETTQVDHIVFAGDKCFVIETKAHAGWIFGTSHDKNWTQMLNKHSKYQFQSPIRQNYKHILAVRDFVGDVIVTGVVVFTRGTFKSDRIEAVLYPNELKSYLLDNIRVGSFDNEAPIEALSRAMITDRGASKAHVRGLQEKYGGRWRTPLANSVLVIACAMFFFRADIVDMVKNSSASTNQIYSKQAAQMSSRVASTNHLTRQPQRYSQSPGQFQRSPQSNKSPNINEKEKVFLPVVSGFTKGKVVLSKGDRHQFLAVGSVTRDGWKLLAADSTSATFLHSSGEKTRVEIK